MKVNKNSDFDLWLTFKDAEGEVTATPTDGDFVVEISCTLNSSRRVEAGRRDGEFYGCHVESGRLHVPMKDHGMSGQLRCVVKMDLADACFDGGVRHVEIPQPLDVTLVSGVGDELATEASVELAMPVVVVTAYDLAVRGGYEGTLQEYMSALTRVDRVVETAEGLSALLSDTAAGKKAVADALTRRGYVTSKDEPLGSMATTIDGMQLGEYVAGGGEDYGYYDLVAVCKAHERGDYPYMYAVTTTDEKITLNEADAFLCSDGFFTEGQGAVHKFEDDRRWHWVIFYNRREDYQIVLPELALIGDAVIYNGAPIMSVIRRGATPFKFLSLIKSEGIHSGIDAAIIETHAIASTNTMSGGTTIYLYAPELESLTSYIVYRGNVRSAVLPKIKQLTTKKLSYLETATSLTTISMASLERMAITTFAYGCTALTNVDLPSLKEWMGTTLLSGCSSIVEISFPSVEAWSGGFIVGAANLTYVKMPKLRSLNTAGAQSYSAWIFDAPNLKDIYLQGIMSISGGIIYDTSNKRVALHLGTQQGATLAPRSDSGSIADVTVEPGFRSTLTLTNISAMTAESIVTLIDNLADNNDGATLTLTLGATLMGKLTEEQIAVATAKNYNVI